MGAYKFDPANPIESGMTGKRNPVKPGGDPDCHCAAVQISPRFLRPLVDRLLRPKLDIITERDLHPNVERVVTSLLSLQDTVSGAKAPNGMSIQLAFTNVQRVEDDFTAELRIRIDQEEVFTGALNIAGVWKRGKVSFSHAVIGAVELLLMHLSETASRDESEIDMRLGIIRMSGKASHKPTVNGFVSDQISGAVALQSGGGGPGDPGGGTCTPDGPFDPLVIFGAFPSSGFQFYHVNGKLVEEPLGG